MMGISVCIASRGPTMGLWMTLASVRNHSMSMAQNQKCNIEFCVCVNGREMDEPLENLLKDVKYVYSPEPLTAPVARNRAAELAEGRLLYFMDDHVIVTQRLMVSRPLSQTIRFFPYYTGFGYKYYHSNLLEPVTRADYAREKHDTEAYQVAAAPHGVFQIWREDWLALGGHEEWYQGHGGEETYFCLSAWHKGYECWLEPRAPYWHYSVRSAIRGYNRDVNEWNIEEGARRLEAAGIRETLTRMKAQGIPGLTSVVD